MNAVRCCLENVATDTSEYLLEIFFTKLMYNSPTIHTSAARDILNTNYNLRSEVVQNR